MPVELAVRFKVAPIQSGALLPAVGASGVALTVTVVDPAKLPQPLVDTVTEYVPDPAVVMAASVGFCKVEVKLFGPVHE